MKIDTITFDVVFACNAELDHSTYKKIRNLERLLPFTKFEYYICESGFRSFKENKEYRMFNRIALSGELFDFSRYNDFLQNYAVQENTILINDTLGKGRKFNLGLWLHIYISLIMLYFGLINISAPYDRDKQRAWMSPYIVLGKSAILRNLNWIDWKVAQKNLSQVELNNIEDWLFSKWRSRVNASINQISAKRKTLILERVLLVDKSNEVKLFSFSKRNPLRWLNSLNF